MSFKLHFTEMVQDIKPVSIWYFLALKFDQKLNGYFITPKSMYHPTVPDYV
jgi:hypothetical protein